MLHDYNIEVNNSNDLKDNTILNCSMELLLLNNLLNLIILFKNCRVILAVLFDNPVIYVLGIWEEEIYGF